LRLAILRNRKTPDVWFILFLPQMRTSEVRDLMNSRRLNPAQKKLVQDELNKRRAG
jgi:hypothetical protein